MADSYTFYMQGKFEIISLNATSLFPKEGDQHGMVQLFVEVVDEDGDFFGGLVHGKLVAETPVQVFNPSNILPLSIHVIMD